MLKTQVLLAAISFACFSNGAMAADASAAYQCKQNGVERKVSIAYPDEGKKAPCEVHYIKDNEDKVIFSAKNEAGFCEKKAEDFMAKLKSLGFNCESAKEAVAEK